MAKVPEVVIGLPEIANTLGTVAATELTVPVPVGEAHAPSPRQKVEADALVPLLRLVTGRLPVTPVTRGKPVALVKTAADGVPSAGVISVGDVENTRLVEVVPVAPAAVKPDILLNAAIPALVAFVPPRATVTGAVREKAVPVSVSPVDAVYDPAPENCTHGIGLVPKVPPASAVHTYPASAFTVPVEIKVKALINSA
jgi:hypothetical protein